MDSLPELTARQRQVFEFIESKIQEWGYPPTIREIGEHLGIKSTNGVADHLKALKRKGYLQQRGHKSRTLSPTEPAMSQSQANNVVPMIPPNSGSTVSIPLLGRVAAGEPILAEEHAEGSVVVDSLLVGGNKKVFALKVVGQSMIEDGIFDGDYIFVQKRSHAQPGEIVVVVIENEATVKRYYPEGDRIRLQPANAAMEPIYINKADFREVQIMGLVVGVYRNMNG
ncbi:MAG: transcriptional repressor LexA [Deltaproteobacteria bacterium]|jgi:repressor LexA|nr:transcriptional repressor LexA [Deltaproteobacteria bacterium]MBT6434150.1 transcriptional repressor LexA [Deltaproteobacteria bacterium]MBT6490193.1 transcriptional repressor LexA [Deltaproteobacteria bacterium]